MNVYRSARLLTSPAQRGFLAAPAMVRDYSAGAIKEGGGKFADKGKSQEEMYFRQKQQELLDKMKINSMEEARAHDDEIEFHEKAIKQHQEAIARHKKLKSMHREDALNE